MFDCIEELGMVNFFTCSFYGLVYSCNGRFNHFL